MLPVAANQVVQGFGTLKMALPWRSVRFRMVRLRAVIGLMLVLMATLSSPAEPVRGWLNWRGPEQVGFSRETGLPEKLALTDALWVADFPGQSAPVVANGKLYLGSANPMNLETAAGEPNGGWELIELSPKK